MVQSTSQALRKQRKEDKHLSLSFQHISFPEYGDSDLIIKGGHRGEPSEGPKLNSSFYQALVKEGVHVVGSGHDHVNDFCAIKLEQQHVPWLCYSGSAGFGAYGQYGETKYWRRARVWQLDTKTGGIKTWKRVEYAEERVDELQLVADGAVVVPSDGMDTGIEDAAAQVPL